jgi:hypothetical protein
MTDKEKLKAIQKFLTKTRKAIDKCLNDDCEYTAAGNGVNCCEASHMFREVEEDIGNILKS